MHLDAAQAHILACNTNVSGPLTAERSWPGIDFAASLALSSCVASVQVLLSCLVLGEDADICKRHSTSKCHAASSVCRLEAQAAAHDFRSEPGHTLYAFFQCQPDPTGIL